MKPLTQTYVLWMVLVGNDRYVDEKLIVDGVDLPLIALMLYGHTRAVGPTSSMTRGPPIDEDFKCTRWEISPIQQRGVYACVAGIDTRSGYVFCEIVTKKQVERRKNRRCASQLKSVQRIQ